MLYIQSFHPNLTGNQKQGSYPASKICSNIYQRINSNLLETDKLRDMYQAYPEYHIDVAEEQFQIMNASGIIWIFPFYWYSVTPLLKLWMDEVLQYGFAYGKEGNALTGKKLQLIVSTGGPKHAYQFDGRNKYSVEDLLKPIERTANLCGMDYLNPLVMYQHPNIPGREGEDVDTRILGDTEKALLVVQRMRTSFLMDE